MRCFRAWCCLLSGHWTSLVCLCRPVVLILVVVCLWAVWCSTSSMHLLAHTSSLIAVTVAFHFFIAGSLVFFLCKGSLSVIRQVPRCYSFKNLPAFRTLRISFLTASLKEMWYPGKFFCNSLSFHDCFLLAVLCT